MNAAPVLEDRSFGCLNTFTAQQIVNQYSSILQNQSYNGQSPQATAQQIIASNYIEYSDSILSLEKAPVCALLSCMAMFAATPG